MERIRFLEQIKDGFAITPIVALIGPRQCGKTTLARDFANLTATLSATNYFDLEDSSDRARLEEPMLALSDLKGLVVIDEVQRKPGLFESLRVLADRRAAPAKFLVLGSASRELLRQSSESLAGRITYIEVTPFSTGEVGTAHQRKLWLRGGYPRAFLASKDDMCWKWLKGYLRTYLEQDIPNLGLKIPSESLGKFWRMLAHYHGQIFNSSEIGKSLGISDTTARRYLDILSGTFLIRELKPWFENIDKRQVKSPKIYFRDSGLYHHLLGIESLADLRLHPRLGASWEAFVIEETIRKLTLDANEVFFWSIHGQTELDLFTIKGSKRLGFEVKYTQQPTLTKSCLKSLELLRLSSLTVLYAGKKEFALAENVRAIPAADFFG